MIRDGELHQIGPPEELTARPADEFVASLTGGNLLHGVAPGGAVLAVHPWAVRVVAEEPEPRDGVWVVGGVVEGVEDEGPRSRVRVGGVVAEVPGEQAAQLERGARAWATFAAADAHVLGDR